MLNEQINFTLKLLVRVRLGLLCVIKLGLES